MGSLSLNGQRVSHDATQREASDDRYRNILSNVSLATGRPRRHRADATSELRRGLRTPGSPLRELGLTCSWR